jgi:PleD family two-component response regulator
MHSDQSRAETSHWAIEPLNILAMSPFECMRENICFALEFFTGATIHRAVDHSTALARIGRAEPDLIVAHADWPRADALQLVSDIRRGDTDLHSATPVVMLMWNPTAELVRVADYLGVDALVRIPYTGRALQLRTTRVLERAGHRGVFRSGIDLDAADIWIAQRRDGFGEALLSHDEIAFLLHPSADNPKVVLPTG